MGQIGQNVGGFADRETSHFSWYWVGDSWSLQKFWPVAPLSWRAVAFVLGMLSLERTTFRAFQCLLRIPQKDLQLS
jgi:hypothetical protein